MPFGITKDHLDFYYKNGSIEFESLLSFEEIDQLDIALETVIHERPWLYAGRDTWRKNSRIKQFALRKDFAEIASNLCKKRGLRIAYDQVIQGPFSEASSNLIEMSAIRKVISGMLVQLRTPPVNSPAFIPQKRGNVTFFSPQCPLDFPKNARLFLIVYAEKKAQYVFEKRDPNVHVLKKFGYAFGDHLNSSTHPILFSF